MSKYIVRNCPCLSMAEYPNGKVEDNLCGLAITQYCKDCADCLIKQVIEKCKKECNPTNDGWCRVKEDLSRELLQLFGIEECNDEVS